MIVCTAYRTISTRSTEAQYRYRSRANKALLIYIWLDRLQSCHISKVYTYRVSNLVHYTTYEKYSHPLPRVGMPRRPSVTLRLFLLDFTVHISANTSTCDTRVYTHLHHRLRFVCFHPTVAFYQTKHPTKNLSQTLSGIS